MTPRRSAFRFGTALTIYRKEMLEVLRDRRTLFLLIAVPLIFYPLLLIVVAEVSASQMEKLEKEEVHVAVMGTLPGPLRHLLDEDASINIQGPEVGHDPLEGLARGDVELVVDVGGDLSSELERGLEGELTLHFDSVVPASAQAHARILKKIDLYRQQVVVGRLAAMDRQAAYIAPLKVEDRDIAPPVRRYGSMVAMILPVLILVFMVTGAFYPAIDLTAGEKERKTIQTLLTAPLHPLEIVTGKYLAVFTMALLSGTINLLSMVLILGHSVMLAGTSGLDLGVDIDAVDVLSLLWVVVLLGLMFSALMMTIATFAKTPKDAQAYISPVYMVCLIPVIISQIPGIDLSETTVFVPVLNLALIMKEILVSGTHFEHLFLVTISTLVVTTVVLLIGSRLFARQEVLVGPGGLSSMSQLIGAKRSPRPSIDEALALLGVLFVLLFYVGAALQSWNLFGGLALTLYGLILLPTVAFIMVRRHDLRATLHLRRPSAMAVIGAALMGGSSLVWISALTSLFHETFLPVPEPFVEAMKDMISVPEGIPGTLLMLLLFALSPALCEESLFRGLLLSSFRGKTSGAVAVGVTAIAFGLFHLSIYRFAGTATLGLFMGWMVWRTGSIWPAVVYHFTNNATAILGQEALASATDSLGLWIMAIAVAVTVLGVALVWRSPALTRAPTPPRPSGEPGRRI